MALLPKLKLPGGTRSTLDVFGGIDRTDRAAEGTWREEANLTAEHWPVFSTRGLRRYFGTLTDPGGLIAGDAMAWVADGKLYINGAEAMSGLSGGVKQLVRMGAYLIILPDRKWINTQLLTDCGDMDNTVAVTGGVTVSLCAADGGALTYTEGASPPAEPADGTLWLDTGGDTPAMKEWSESSAAWLSVATVYVKLAGTGIAAGFAVYDGVELSGLTGGAAGLNTSAVLYGVHHDAQTPGNDYLITVGVITGGEATVSTTVTVARQMPEVDFVTECGNRLWGCKYGMDTGGKAVNEIYASKLGDFKNWRCFMGLSTDSYAASRGGDGVFTGAITYLGHPLFFREESIEKVYPGDSGAHQIVTTAARGVQKGCERSLAIVGETLYYKSRDGVCAYTGSLPVSVGRELGEVSYSNARAGAEGEVYYLSMRDGADDWHLYTYDTARRIWHREDDTQALGFATLDGKLYWIEETTGALVCRSDEESLYQWLGQSTAEDTEDLAWHAVSGVIDYGEAGNKAVRRFVIRAEVDGDMKLELRYDESPWRSGGTYHGDGGLCSFVLPVPPRRCDHLRLRLSGTGSCRIYSIAIYKAKGSDVMRR